MAASAGVAGAADDAMFHRILSEPDMQSLAGAMVAEHQRLDVGRIASTLMCTDGIDPSIVTFAKQRTAAHWGLAEDQLDVLIATRLIHKATRLMVDLRDVGHAEPQLATAA